MKMNGYEVGVFTHIEGGGNAVAFPDYWQDAVEEAGNKVKAIQKSAGYQAAGFVLCSDMHCEPSGVNNDYIKNIGTIAAKVMEDCALQFVCVAGDSTTQSADYDIEDMEPNMAIVRNILKPVKDERLLLAIGNHDGATGTTVENGQTVYYRHQLKEEELYNVYFRKYAAACLSRHYGNGGTYFYVDDTPNKLRYIVLNTHWTVWDGNADGFTTDIQRSYFHNSIYGQQQLSWLANVALNMDDGWNAVIIQHVSSDGADNRYIKDRSVFNAIINGFNAKTEVSASYTGSYEWQSSTIVKNYAGSNGTVIAVFVGHKHADSINTSVLTGCPIISVTTCGAYSDIRDTNAPNRTPGTDTETAIDIVTIDKEAKQIYLTRLGAGADRQCSFGTGSSGGVTAPDTPAIDNLLPSATDTEGNVYNGTGYKKPYYIDTMGNVADGSSYSSDVAATGFIPCAVGDTLYISGMSVNPSDANASTYCIAVYDADYATITAFSIAAFELVFNCVKDSNGNISSFTLSAEGVDGLENTAYIRFTALEIGASSAIGKPTSSVGGGGETGGETSANNLLASAIDAGGSVYNGTGWKQPYRINSSGNAVEASSYSADVCATGFIPCKVGDTLYISGMTIDPSNAKAGSYNIAVYNSSFEKITASTTADITSSLPCETDSNGYVTSITLQDDAAMSVTGTAYIRLTALGINEASSITVNKQSSGGGSGDTGGGEDNPETPVTNVLTNALDTDGSIYNGTGWKKPYRINSSGTEVEASSYSSDVCVTGFIACNWGDRFSISGMTINPADEKAGSYNIGFYNENHEKTFTLPIAQLADTLPCETDSNGYVTSIYFDETDSMANLYDLAYIRITALNITDGCAVELQV